MDAVAALRHFNRSFTQRIGVLQESFLGSGRSVGLSRLLFEIGPEGREVQSLRAGLGLDSGYVSRLLRQLEADGLVSVTTHPSDGRRRTAGLTAAGVEEWHRLDAGSDDLARGLLDPLTDRQRHELVEALATASRLLVAATASFDPIDPREDEARQAVARYIEEIDRRFPTGFRPGDVAPDTAMFTPPAGIFLVVRSDDRTIGCGGVQRLDDTTAEVKRMWIHPTWRGLGLSRRLLRALEAHAVDLGYRSIVLDTNSELTEARRLYRSSGYEPVERYNDNPYAQHWYRKRL